MAGGNGEEANPEDEIDRMFELLVACIDTRRQVCSERRHMETLERGPEGRGDTEEIEKEIWGS